MLPRIRSASSSPGGEAIAIGSRRPQRARFGPLPRGRASLTDGDWQPLIGRFGLAACLGTGRQRSRLAWCFVT
jgi:hypothetical protein